jgi:hypothetical protein
MNDTSEIIAFLNVYNVISELQMYINSDYNGILS